MKPTLLCVNELCRYRKFIKFDTKYKKFDEHALLIKIYVKQKRCIATIYNFIWSHVNDELVSLLD